MKIGHLTLFFIISFFPEALLAFDDFGSGTRITSEVEFAKGHESASRPELNWQPIQLPAFRAKDQFERMTDQETLWFRVPVDDLIVSENDLQSLYIWRHNMRLSVFLDELYLGGTINPEAPDESIGWNHPVLVDLPLRDSPSTYLYIRVDGGPTGVILSPLVSGSRTALKTAYDTRYSFQIQSATWSFFLCLLLAGLSIWLWAQRRTESLYLDFAAMSVLSATTLSFFFLTFIPIGLHAWLYIQHTATDWISYFMLAYAAQALEQKWQLARRSVLLVCVTTTCLYGLLPADSLQPVAYLVHGTLSLLLMTIGLYVLYITVRRPDGTRLWFSAAFIGFLVVNLHDFSAVFLSTPEEHIRASNWLHLTSPLMALAFFAHLVHRFIHALEASEQLNRDLEARVEASRQALELSYAENREMELRQTADSERQKIYRELHDDLGSKLVSIVHSAEGSKQSDLARSALESLRASIYKARHGKQKFNELAQAITLEAELRLENAGISFTHSGCELPDRDIDPEAAYHITRIFREGVSNLLQHAQSDTAHLVFERDRDVLRIGLWDKGIGSTDGFYASGGLNNIKFRADRINAKVEWHSADPGCKLMLSLPWMQINESDNGVQTI